MRELTLYGLSYNFADEVLRKQRDDYSAKASIVFKTLYRDFGIRDKALMSIMVNEVVRERIKLNAWDKMVVLEEEVRHCLTVLPASTIVVLRSLGYEFKDIYELSSRIKRLGIREFLDSEGLENPEVEVVSGVNSERSNSGYLPFEGLAVC